MESWLRRQGFTSVQADAERNYVRATGSVAAIDAAFKTRLENYQSSAGVNAGPYQLHANDRPVAIPRSLAQYVIGLTGLDNAAPRLPLMRQPGGRGGTTGQPTASCSQYYGQHHISGLPQQFGRTSFPTQVCGYQPAQMRGAYGASMRNDGHGQKVSVVELGLAPDMFLTLQDYAKAGDFLAPSPRRYAELSLGKNTCGDPFNVEEQLDVETSYDMAPGANQLVVGGDSCNKRRLRQPGAVRRRHRDHRRHLRQPPSPAGQHQLQLLGPRRDSQPAILTNIMHAYLVRAAAQGVGMYFASGDSSGVETPDDPFAILVGGPKNKPPKFVELTVGGTSMASPLVAGIIADAQQGQHTVFGFTDPVLYQLNGTPALHDILPSTSRTPGLFRGEVCNVAFCGRPSLITFDDQNPAMTGYTGQVTLKGYDNMTGIGTPRGQAFISALRRLEG